VARLNAEMFFGRAIQPGDVFTDYLVNWDRASFDENFEVALRGEVRSSERKVTTLRGDTRHSALRYIPAVAPDGTVLGVTLCSQDITERKQAEEALRIANEQFSRVFHASPMGICISTSKEGRFVDVNEAFVEMYGFKNKEQLLGKTVYALKTWAKIEERS